MKQYIFGVQLYYLTQTRPNQTKRSTKSRDLLCCSRIPREVSEMQMNSSASWRASNFSSLFNFGLNTVRRSFTWLYSTYRDIWAKTRHGNHRLYIFLNYWRSIHLFHTYCAPEMCSQKLIIKHCLREWVRPHDLKWKSCQLFSSNENTQEW